MAEAMPELAEADESGIDAEVRAEPAEEQLPPHQRALRRTLDALDRDGAAQLDGPGYALALALLERAAGLGDDAAQRLEARAEARMADLAQRIDDARALARAALDGFGEADEGRREALADAIEQSDWPRALRLASAPYGSRAAGARDDVPGQGARVYRDGLADLYASLSAARAVDAPPEQAGLLNGRVLADRLLAEAGAISTEYRRMLIAELVDLASLLHLPEIKAPRRKV